MMAEQQKGVLHIFICAALVAGVCFTHAINWYWQMIPLIPVILLALFPAILSRAIFVLTWRELGFNPPQNLRALKPWFMAFGGLCPLIVVLGFRYSSAEAYYADLLSGDPFWREILRLVLFAAVSAGVMEFFFRGFFFFGLRKWKVLGLKASIFFVLVGEVVLHLYKPGVEALGLLALSPLLSWMAYKSRSLLVPFLVRLWIEAWFVIAVFISRF